MYWKLWVFETAQYLARGTSNLLVTNMYWMVEFKIYVFDALFEETPNRSNTEIWESFLLWIFSPVLWILPKSVLLSSK